MLKVHKHSINALDDDGCIAITIQAGAKILTVQTHQGNGEPCVWALIDPNAPMVKRRFLTLMTGQPIATMDLDNAVYVGTCQVRTGPIVIVAHVFDLGEVSTAT